MASSARAAAVRICCGLLPNGKHKPVGVQADERNSDHEGCEDDGGGGEDLEFEVFVLGVLHLEGGGISVWRVMCDV